MSMTERTNTLLWLADIVRCAEASLTRWQECHRNAESGALTFHGDDGPFYEGMRSVVDRLRDYHYEMTRRAAGDDDARR